MQHYAVIKIAFRAPYTLIIWVKCEGDRTVALNLNLYESLSRIDFLPLPDNIEKVICHCHKFNYNKLTSFSCRLGCCCGLNDFTNYRSFKFLIFMSNSIYNLQYLPAVCVTSLWGPFLSKPKIDPIIDCTFLGNRKCTYFRTFIRK